MNTSLKIKNIVLVGITLPANMDRYFFVKNGIFKEEEIQPASIFSPGFLRIITEKYSIVSNLMANPVNPAVFINQLILTVNTPSSDDKLSEIMTSIVKSANLINCTSLGMNFHWYMNYEGKETSHEISKKYFYSDKIKLFSDFFTTDDAHYGVYASKNIKKARLKLDVKPILYNDIIPVVSIGKSAIQFGFNFHIDVDKKESTAELIGHLSEYNEYFKESEKIMSIYK